jgi:hypothetical protein
VPHAASLAAFERGIALDSTFLVPYFHASDLALRLGRAASAARLARHMTTLVPPSAAPYYRLLAEVLATPAPFSNEARRLLDSLPGRYVGAVIGQLATMPDSAATAVALARLQLERPTAGADPADSTALADAVALALAARGRFREAAASRRGPLPPSLLVQLALLDAAPRDSVAERARRWLRSDPVRALPAVRLWAELGDTLSIARVARWADSARAPVPARAESGAPSAVPASAAPIARAYLALARGDTAAALRGFLAVPMSACNGAPCAGATVAALLAATGRDVEAARVLDRWMPSVARTSVALPPSLLLRARLAEELGEDERAIEAYRQVVALWSGGDPETRAATTEAEAALRRLTGGRR